MFRVLVYKKLFFYLKVKVVVILNERLKKLSKIKSGVRGKRVVVLYVNSFICNKLNLVSRKNVRIKVWIGMW